MKKKYLLLFFCCICFVRLTAQYEQLLHKTHGQRYAYLHSILAGKIENPDSTVALNVIKAVAKIAVQNGDDDLLLESKNIEVSYYHYHSVVGHYPPELVRARINGLLQEAKKRRSLWLEGLLEGALATSYYASGEYESAFGHGQRMYVIFSKQSVDECPEKLNYICEFANRLYWFRDYRPAIHYLDEAVKDSVQRPWDLYFVQCPNTLGLCYRELNELDSSSYYFRMAKRRAKMNNNRAWEGICNGNLGENYFLQKDYEKAKPLLQDDADVATENHDWGVAANALTILGEISLVEKDMKAAERYLMKARECAQWSSQYKRLARLYPVLSKFYILTGNRAAASDFFDSSFIAHDSVDREFNTLYRARALQKVELEKEHASVSQLNSEQKIRTLQRNALVVIIVLGSIVVLFIYNKQRRLYREKNEQLKRAAEELETAARDLDKFTKSVAEKNNLIETLQEQVGSPDLQVLRQLQESTILTEEQWLDFKKLFDKVHAGYLQRLQQKLPALTPAETRFIVLSKLRLSGREMASMLGVGPEAIRQYRSRLRKKLELPEEETIDELISAI